MYYLGDSDSFSSQFSTSLALFQNSLSNSANSAYLFSDQTDLPSFSDYLKLIDGSLPTTPQAMETSNSSYYLHNQYAETSVAPSEIPNTDVDSFHDSYQDKSHLRDPGKDEDISINSSQEEAAFKEDKKARGPEMSQPVSDSHPQSGVGSANELPHSSLLVTAKAKNLQDIEPEQGGRGLKLQNVNDSEAESLKTTMFSKHGMHPDKARAGNSSLTGGNQEHAKSFHSQSSQALDQKPIQKVEYDAVQNIDKDFIPKFAQHGLNTKNAEREYQIKSEEVPVFLPLVRKAGAETSKETKRHTSEARRLKGDKSTKASAVQTLTKPSQQASPSQTITHALAQTESNEGGSGFFMNPSISKNLDESSAEDGKQNNTTLSNLMFQNSASKEIHQSNTVEMQVFLTPEGLISSEAESAQVPRMNSNEFMHQFKTQFRQHLGADIVRQARYIFKGQNSGEISLVLKPDKFGRVRIRMNLADKSIGGRIFVENKYVQEAFTDLLEDLKQAFIEQGFEDLNLDISLEKSQDELPVLQTTRADQKSQDVIHDHIELAIAYINEFDSVNILV